MTFRSLVVGTVGVRCTVRWCEQRRQQVAADHRTTGGAADPRLV